MRWEGTLAWFIVMVMALLVSMKNPKGQVWRSPADGSPQGNAAAAGTTPGLQYDFYRFSCPDAESIIWSTVQRLIRNDSSVAPALLRFAFHDCFVEGCDASILLESVHGFHAEKYAFPNKDSLRGYHFIQHIKTAIEQQCPNTVSCADIIVLSARDAVRAMGGHFYPLETGRRDGTISIASMAEANLPSPQDDINTTLSKFMSRGFTDAEVVSLLGAHTMGRAQCRFFSDRLKNFNGTGRPDPTMDEALADTLRGECKGNASAKVAMDQGSESAFDSHYYQNVAAGRGVLYVDQSLMATPKTAQMVAVYASDVDAFRRDFAMAMIKLSNLRVLTISQGQIRTNCSRLSSHSSSSSSFLTQPEIVP